jgi:hypothetical protein
MMVTDPKDFEARDLVEVVVVAIEEEGADIFKNLAKLILVPSLELFAPTSCNVIEREACATSTTSWAIAS